MDYNVINKFFNYSITSVYEKKYYVRILYQKVKMLQREAKIIDFLNTSHTFKYISLHHQTLTCESQYIVGFRDDLGSSIMIKLLVYYYPALK